MKYLLITLALITPALATEPKKREFVPMVPKSVSGQTSSEEPESANKDLPKHDPKRVYYGPDGSLFPKIKFSECEIKFAK